MGRRRAADEADPFVDSDDAPDCHGKALFWDFLFVSMCACNPDAPHRTRFGNILCVSSLSMVAAIVSLYQARVYWLMAMVVWLMAVSVLYHATHDGCIRAADICNIVAVVIGGSIQIILEWLDNGLNIYLLAAIACIVPLNAIYMCPLFQTSYHPEDHPKNKDMIILPAHFAVHLFTTAVFVFIGLGSL